MNLLTISSSPRTSSQTAKVAQFIHNEAAKHDFAGEHVDLQALNLPFFSGNAAEFAMNESWLALVEQIKAADAFVLATPEWNGMASPMLKNFLMAIPNGLAANKPALLVTVSAGLNGAYPIAELRGHAFKNNRIVPIPEHLIVRYAEETFNQVAAEGKPDELAHQRLQDSLLMLRHYAEALQAVQSAYNDKEWKPTGM
ncbi:NADPH-dependent FMN reductase [Salinibius halmophilus]|uniref:NADPH-dependent FMN reductase n=1 Tax=Salinibius halmophilus TaxID=1853216 RepID=UPI000E66F969|nr:NAD(P)H-dependent oxidoreductase [Salinibius halmophilus]